MSKNWIRKEGKWHICVAIIHGLGMLDCSEAKLRRMYFVGNSFGTNGRNLMFDLGAFSMRAVPFR